MGTEAKAKVVASIWRASCFASDDVEETVEFVLFFQIDRGKTDSAARNWTNFAPQTDATTFTLLSPSFFCGVCYANFEN